MYLFVLFFKVAHMAINTKKNILKRQNVFFCLIEAANYRDEYQEVYGKVSY